MPDPNNIIIHRWKTIGFCIPKSANESIKNCFMSILGIPLNLHPSLAFETCSKYDADDLKDYYKFTFIRNPFDRLVSCWAQKTQSRRWHRPFGKFGMRHGMSFEEFANMICDIPDDESDQHWRSQAYDLMIGNRIIPDFIGRFENIGPDWNTVRFAMKYHNGVEIPNLPHVNKSEHKPYRDCYTWALRKKVTERYRKDLQVFRYEF